MYHAKSVEQQDQDLERAGSGWFLDRPPLPFETSVPGVFAIGDVRSGSSKRLATAVGEGAAVVTAVHEYLAAKHDDPAVLPDREVIWSIGSMHG